MGQPSTPAPAGDRARWVIAASITVLLAAAVASIVVHDDEQPVAARRTAPSSTAMRPAPERAPPAPSAGPAADEPTSTTTSTSPAAPPSTVAPTSTTTAPADHAALLRGRTFESVSVVEGSTERAFTDDGAVRVQFDGTRDVVRWRISCNTAGGTVTVSADRLTVHEIASSAVGCGPEKEAEDEWLTAFFDAGPAWMLDGSRLVLRSGDDVITLDEVPAERFAG